MQVKDLMNPRVTYCAASDNLETVARLMWETDCGCIPVCSSNGIRHVIGMVTDRDICMSALFAGKALRELTVAGLMTRQPVTCRPTDSLTHVEKLLRDEQIRRVPVVDDEGALVGIIGLADIARRAAREHGSRQPHVSGTEVGTTLAAICTPAPAPRMAL